MPRRRTRSRRSPQGTSTGSFRRSSAFTARRSSRAIGWRQRPANRHGGSSQMPMDRTERLNGIVAALNDYIEVVRAYDLDETAGLLRMAKLDLQMRIHDISDEELQALCEALERGQAASGAAAGPAAPAPAWPIATPAWFCQRRRPRIAF